MFTLIGKTNFDFVGKRYIGFVVSAALTSLGIWAIVQIAANRAPMTTDFSGGAAIQLRLEKAVPAEQLRAALKAGYPEAEIQQVGAGAEYLIRIRSEKG
jgi:preprotein translocase subunit SecF